MNTILVPLDGSTLAEQTLSYVQTLAHVLHTRVYLCTSSRISTRIAFLPVIVRCS